MAETLAAVIVPLSFFGSILTWVWMRQHHRIEELKVIRGQGAGGADLANEIRQIQQQLHELRDTTTRYDMSFDAALQRLESRVSHLEVQQQETQGQVNLTQR